MRIIIKPEDAKRMIIEHIQIEQSIMKFRLLQECGLEN